MIFERLCLRFLLLPLLSGMMIACSNDYPGSEGSRVNEDGLKIVFSNSRVNPIEAEEIINDIKLYCFAQYGSLPTGTTGSNGGLESPFSHIVSGVTREGMTLSTKQMRVGEWDLVMVASRGASLLAPVVPLEAGKSLMYNYVPVEASGKSSDAHQIFHRYHRLPEIEKDGERELNSGISRNVAKIRIVVERAIDVDAAANAHTVTLSGVPNKLSWAGTVLRTVSSDSYVTDVDQPDVTTVSGKVSFISAGEKDIYKSDTLDFIIPAHRGKDFWNDDLVSQNPNPTDTLKRKMNLSVSFTKANGKGTFEKTLEVPVVACCNQVLLLKLKMQDASLEMIPVIQDWEEEDIDGSSNAPFLNVSETKVNVCDGAASRIYFWSNQPSDAVFVEIQGKDENNNPITDINMVFDRLAGTDPATSANRVYNYTVGEGGMGYIDIALLSGTTEGTSVRKIYLNAGGLKRELEIKSMISSQAAKNIATPYAGVFHRWNEKGERIVTWNHSGEWNAVVEGDVSVKGDVLMDRLPSDAMVDGTLYTSSPGDPEFSHISAIGASGGIHGQNRIYFRVGWKSILPNANVVRYAKIVVRSGSVVGNGIVINTLYLRQGEEADYVMRNSDPVDSDNYSNTGRPAAVKFSPYNLWSSDLGGVADHVQLSVRGGYFTQYPSQAGSFFQWASATMPRYAYHPTVTGAISGWDVSPPAGYWTDASDLAASHETSPVNYRRPNDGVTDAANTVGGIEGSEYRQSLWLNPQSSSASDVGNSVWGFYADGFFDRREIVQVDGTSSYCAVSNHTKNVAYVGRLFYNPMTLASIFFPAAGKRANANGILSNAGTEGCYWSASSSAETLGCALNFSDLSAKQENFNRGHGFNIRSVKP